MEGFVLGPDEGTSYTFLGGEVRALALAEDTGLGSISIETFPSGFASPLHVHHRDAGVFFLLSGMMRIRCGDEEWIASPGSTIFLPPGVPHAFRVEGNEPASWFSIQSPFGDFVEQAKAQAEGIDTPLTRTGEPAIQRLGPSPFTE